MREDAIPQQLLSAGGVVGIVVLIIGGIVGERTSLTLGEGQIG
jgi:hypothetical protein